MGGIRAVVAVRHAESEANLSRREDPSRNRVGGWQPRIKLAPVGPEQARLLAARIGPAVGEILGHDYKIVEAWSSTAYRAIETGRIVQAGWSELEGLPIRKTRLLAEIRKGIGWLGGDQGVCERMSRGRLLEGAKTRKAGTSAMGGHGQIVWDCTT